MVQRVTPGMLSRLMAVDVPWILSAQCRWAAVTLPVAPVYPMSVLFPYTRHPVSTTVCERCAKMVWSPSAWLIRRYVDADAEFVFKILDVFRHARLRCVKTVGHFSQIEVASDGFADDAELLEIHGWSLAL